MQQSDNNRRRIRFPRPRWKRIACVFVVIALGAVWLYLLIDRDPVWWSPPDARAESTVELGHLTEQFVLERLHQGREDDDDWHLRLKDEEMNAWLTVNLPQWIHHETNKPWPQAISLPQVGSEEDGFNIGFRIPHKYGDRVVSVRILPVIDESGLRLSLDHVAIGQAAVPGAMAKNILELIRNEFDGKVSDEGFQEIVDLLFGEQVIDPVLTLADGRVVELLDVHLEDGGTVFSLRTLFEATSEPQNVSNDEDSP